jgi:uncharacterized membrane protein HdeD (DUF308 family)
MATESRGPVVQTARRFTGWYIVAAIAFIVLGLFAIIEPAVAGLGVAILVGWLLIFGGICYFVTAFQGGGAWRVLWQVLAGIVFVLGGFYMLALLLGAVIFAAGVFEIISYVRRTSEEASGWVLFNGIVAVLLGALIWFHWPSSSVWAIGTLVGVNLLLTGITRLMLGMAGRRLIGRLA